MTTRIYLSDGRVLITPWAVLVGWLRRNGWLKPTVEEIRADEAARIAQANTYQKYLDWFEARNRDRELAMRKPIRIEPMKRVPCGRRTRWKL